MGKPERTKATGYRAEREELTNRHRELGRKRRRKAKDHTATREEREEFKKQGQEAREREGEATIKWGRATGQRGGNRGIRKRCQREHNVVWKKGTAAYGEGGIKDQALGGRQRQTKKQVRTNQQQWASKTEREEIGQ